IVRSTMVRDRAQQSCPALANTEAAASPAAWATFASPNTMQGDLPPNSSETRLMVWAAADMMARPVAVSPVNPILAMSGCDDIAAPMAAPGPGTTLSTPGGIPASNASSPSLSALSGVRLAGLSTTVFPQASAG